MSKSIRSIIIVLSAVLGSVAFADQVEIYCTIRNNGGNLACQTMGKERRVMNPEDITNFVDQGAVAAYITLKGRKGIERTYLVDARSPLYKHLAEVKRTSSISEIAKARSDLFNDIEKKVIKLSDELDGQSSAAELVLYDSGITYEKMKREQRGLQDEVDGYRKNKDKICTNTPAFEQISKANGRMQQTLSNIVFAFQTPSTCMADYKVFKNKDGSVDLRQLDTVADHYKSSCKR